MPTDVKLDQGDGTMLELDANVVKATAFDLVLDSPVRHTGGEIHRKNGSRRALVHDFADGLTINWDGDYPGGVTINGTIITLNTFTPDNPNAAGDVSFTFWHPDDVTPTGGTPGFNETVFLGELLSQIRDQISSLMFRITQLESK
jgi:hypothetical protein